MKKNFIDKMKIYSQKAYHVINKKLDLNDLSFDHVCYQTKSAKDYINILNILSKDIIIIKEISHSGRRITIAKLRGPFNVNSLLIDKIEISEPKPKRAVTKSNFDHFAFKVNNNFDEYINNIKTKDNIKIIEEKQIFKDKIAKFKEDNIEIELRNNKIGEENELNQKRINIEVTDDNNIEKIKMNLKNETENKLRALADYQNLTKRTEEEKNRYKLLANAVILNKIIDIIEDFERALKNTKIDEKDLLGLRLILKKLKDILYDSNLDEIRIRIGDKIDPRYCEAIGIVAINNKDEDNTIKEIIQKGYKLKEEEIVVRHAKVIVGKSNS